MRGCGARAAAAGRTDGLYYFLLLLPMGAAPFLAEAPQPVQCAFGLCVGLGVIAAVLGSIFWRFHAEEAMLWLQSRQGTQAGVYRVPWVLLLAGASFCAPGGLWVCLVISVVWNYRDVTATLCGGQRPVNFMPSISACIGDFSTQRWIWRAAMVFYIWQRMLSAPLFYGMFGEAAGFGPLNTCRSVIFFTEQVGLIMLTVVSSTENLIVHQLCLVTFAACSFIGMFMTYVLCRRWLRRAQEGAFGEHPNKALAADTALTSLRWRGGAIMVNVTALAGMVFWFIAHETYCRDNYYSYFALCEWTFVYSNIAFHYCEFSEIRGLHLTFDRAGRPSPDLHMA